MNYVLSLQTSPIEFEPNEVYNINVVVSTGEGKAKPVRVNNAVWPSTMSVACSAAVSKVGHSHFCISTKR